MGLDLIEIRAHALLIREIFLDRTILRQKCTSQNIKEVIYFQDSGGTMIAAKKINALSIDEFIEKHEGTRCQFHKGEVWQAQATTPDHSHIQLYIGRFLANYFGKTSGPGGGSWLFTEVAVKYGENSLFCHDLAGWRRSRVPERPRRYPVTERPDWVCEILSKQA